MRHFCFTIIFISFYLISCTPKNHEKSSSSKIEYDYSLVENKHIEWSELFSQKESKYFAYIYSDNCGYCNKIKNNVIQFALQIENYVYFIRYSDQIPIVNFTDDFIGENDINIVGIRGTPTMIEINDWKIAKYYLGSKEITDYLLSH